MKISWENREETALRLVVFSVAGACFGVDTDQIAAIVDFTTDTDREEVVMLAERLAKRGQSRICSPTAILEVRCDSHIRRVAVDRVEEFIEITSDAIRPLPTLVRPYAIESGIWGIVTQGGRMLLLLDFAKLPGLCDLPR